MEKKKVKYDMWFLIVLVILLWALVNQLFALCSWLPGNWADFNLWMRVVANCIAVFGVIWVFRMYISNTKRQARRNERVEKAIEEHPELKDIIKDIMGR